MKVGAAKHPLRIAMLISGTGVNGAVNHVLLLSRFLAARGHRVLLLHRPGAWIAQQPGIDGLELFATSFSRTPRELIRVGRAMNAFAPDVVHTHMSSAHSYGMLGRILARRPVVATAHSQLFQLHWWFNNIVIATSASTADYQHEVNRVPRSRLRTQANFVDAEAFPAVDDEERRAARSEFGFGPDAVVIGCVGEVGERKRQLDLVSAMPEVLRVVPGARVLLVGHHHGDYVAEVRRVIQERGLGEKVVWAGQRTDIRHVLAAMDIFALVSRQESGPLAVLEAMAAGLPALVTNVGDLPDYVEDGKRGYVVAAGDITAIAERLTRLAADPELRRSMGRAAYAAVRDRYDIAKAGMNIEAILAEAAGIRNRPLLGFIGALVGPQRAP